MLLTLARHGETVENVRGVVQGHWPGRLTRLGCKQAQQLADRLKKQQFDAIYSSDLKRCLDTAEYVRRYHMDVPFFVDKNLREISFGGFEGKLQSEVDWMPPVKDFWQYSRGGGETNLQLYRRIISAVNEIYKNHPEGKVLVVTHGWPMKVIQSAMTGDNLEDIYPLWLENCAVANYEINDPVEAAPPVSTRPTVQSVKIGL